MILNKEVIITISILLFTQVLVWYQLNGQLVWNWAKNNPFLLSCLGLPVSYMFILSTKYGYEGFGALWPVRFMGFATSMMTFPLMTWLYLGESITLKTFISIILAVIIMLLQLL